jgi:hypothetical protein
MKLGRERPRRGWEITTSPINPTLPFSLIPDHAAQITSNYSPGSVDLDSGDMDLQEWRSALRAELWRNSFSRAATISRK